FDEQFHYLATLEARLKAGDKQARTFKISPLEEDKKIYQHSQKEQSHIIVGFRSLTFTDPDRLSLQILQAILAGQRGRLFLELRDKASLAYSVAPLVLDGLDTGYFGFYIGCSPEKGKKAISMIGDEIERILRSPPDDDEVRRAKRYLV